MILFIARNGSREIRTEADRLLIHGGDDNGLDHDASIGYGEKWSDSRCILKVNSLGFANGLEVGYARERERERELNNDFKISVVSN